MVAIGYADLFCRDVIRAPAVLVLYDSKGILGNALIEAVTICLVDAVDWYWSAEGSPRLLEILLNIPVLKSDPVFSLEQYSCVKAWVRFGPIAITSSSTPAREVSEDAMVDKRPADGGYSQPGCVGMREEVGKRIRGRVLLRAELMVYSSTGCAYLRMWVKGVVAKVRQRTEVRKCELSIIA